MSSQITRNLRKRRPEWWLCLYTVLGFPHRGHYPHRRAFCFDLTVVGDYVCRLMRFPLNSSAKAPDLQGWKMKFSASVIRIRPSHSPISVSHGRVITSLSTSHSSDTLQLCLLMVYLFSMTGPNPPLLGETSSLLQFLAMSPLFSISLCQPSSNYYHNYHLTLVFLIASSALLNVQLFLQDTMSCMSFRSPNGLYTKLATS